MSNLTADDLRYWANYMDNPQGCPRPDGPDPATVSELLISMKETLAKAKE